MNSFDASTRTDLDIHYEFLTDAVTELRTHTDRLVIVGAVARDLLASAAGNLPISRATRDVDIAVAINAISDYRSFDPLVPGSTPPTYVFRGVRVDVIPFGRLESARTVRFDNDVELDVTGMAEAAAHAVAVTLPGGAVVPVAPLAAQSVLKLVAWHHRGTGYANKDALDLRLILEAASRGMYLVDDSWSDPSLEAYEYDMQLVGAHRLGRSAAGLLDPIARTRVHEVLASEEERLVRAMPRLLSADLVRAYRQGWEEG